MSASPGRPAPVRGWLLRAAVLLTLFLAIGAVTFATDLQHARKDRHDFARALPATGTVLDRGEESHRLIVTYRHPVSGRTIVASTSVRDDDRWPAQSHGTVPLEVDAHDAEHLVVQGDREAATVNIGVYGILILAAGLLLLARWRTVRRTERLVRAPGQTFAMRAVAIAPTDFGYRWRLHLHAVDGVAAGRPVCIVPLVAPPPAGLDRVEVKGSPRPGGTVVARIEDGEVLWPSGRALLRTSTRRTPSLPGWLPAAVVVAGVMAFVIGGSWVSDGRDNDEIKARAQPAVATVVDAARDGALATIRYRLGERQHTTVLRTSAKVGTAIGIYVDPKDSGRAWHGDQNPPGSSPHTVAVLLEVASFVLIPLGGFAMWSNRHRAGTDGRRRSPRASKVLLVAGVAGLVSGFVLISIGLDADTVRDRAITRTAQATAESPAGTVVRFRYDGKARTAVVHDELPVGDRVQVRIDPIDPTRAWRSGQVPPGTSEHWLGAYVLTGSLVLLAVAGVNGLRRRLGRRS